MGNDDPRDADEGAVLSPEELDFTDAQNVAELEEGRYLVSPDASAEPGDAAPEGEGAVPDATPAEDSAPAAAGSIGATEVNEWLEAHVSATDAEFGFHVTAAFEGSVARQELHSDDVVTTFESLLTWYARHVSTDTPVEEVLAILLLEANVPLEFPPSALEALLEREDVSPEDSVADLLAAVEERGGVRLPSTRTQ
jgi:hypothetical protein